MNARDGSQQRAMVAKLPREELEDQYLRIIEDNLILKTHGRKQEEKIKKMATKLMRLVNDRKKLIAASGTVSRSTRDVDLEETIENQQDRIRQITKENEALKQKLEVAQQQMINQRRRQTPYNKVPSRIDSGIARKHGEGSDGRHGGKSDRMSTRTTSPRPGRYGHSLLEEARNENHRLHQQILVLQEQIARLEDDNQSLRRDINQINAAHEDEVLHLREHVNSKQKSSLGDNIEMIKLQRSIKDKANDVTAMQGRYEELQSNYQRLRASYDEVIHEMERLKFRLVQEESKNLSLQNSLKHGGTHQHVTSQLREQVRELEQEVSILKEANDKLTMSAFDVQKEQQWRELERKLRVQIAQLEAAIQVDMNDKNNILDKISTERGYASRIHSQSRKIHDDLERVKQENSELRERLRIYSASEDAVDVDELRAALAVIRKKRHDAVQQQRPDFLENVDDVPKDLETEFSELQGQHAETIQELDKTREMLLMQHKINKDYQIEVESVTNHMEDIRKEYEGKLERFARLLDARAARIKKLESQLHDVAYGTKQFRIQPERDEMEVDEALDETIQLERGENLFEINVSKVTLNNDAIMTLDDREPSLFITYAFYDYELVSTPILKSSSPRYDFTAQFTVKVDDLFLHHLQRENTVFELHQAMGIDHQTVATCKIRFNKLLDTPQGKLHGTATIIGLNGSNYGTLEYWIRLRVPMDQAIRLYRERTKALGYLSANTAATQKTLEVLDSSTRPPTDNTNQLLLQIMSCNHVRGRREGIQPNVYCVYKFFDFADHDTVIIPCTNNPHFDDRQAYPVQMNAELDAYLKSEKLIIYVFDDTDPDMTSYLGKALIDLLPLAHDKVIKAPFQLLKSDNTENGTVEVAARWQLTYTSPKRVMKGEGSLEEEEEIREAKMIMKKPPATPKKRQNVVSKLSRPSASSTPKPSKKGELKPILRTSQVTYPDQTLEPVKDEERNLLEHDEPAERDHPTPADLDEPAFSNQPEQPHSSPRPTPKKREKPTRVEDSSSEYKEVEEIPKLGLSKKVSIVEPDKKPVALARSITKPVKVNPFDEESEEDLEELMSEPDNGLDEQQQTFPKLTYVASTEETNEETSEDHPQPPTPASSSESLKNIPSPQEDEEDILSDVASFDSGHLSPEQENLASLEDEPTKEDNAQSPPEDTQTATSPEEEGESEIEEDIEEIPDDTERAQEDVDEEEQQSAEEKEEMDGSDGATEREILPQKDNTVRISINHLTLDPNTSVWGDSSVEKMFIEYDFLGSVEETPDALPKPKNKGDKLNYQFEKAITIGAEQRNLLSSMMTSGQTSFKMTVVSEPNNDEDEDCEEIGTAAIDLAAILKSKRDIINDDVVVEDLRAPGEAVGKLNVTVEALDILRLIKRELDARLRDSEM